MRPLAGNRGRRYTPGVVMFPTPIWACAVMGAVGVDPAYVSVIAPLVDPLVVTDGVVIAPAERASVVLTVVPLSSIELEEIVLLVENFGIELEIMVPAVPTRLLHSHPGVPVFHPSPCCAPEQEGRVYEVNALVPDPTQT